MRTEAGGEDVLWRIIESRDRAFATAHRSFRQQITAKEAEIASLREKEREIAEKQREIDRLALVLAERETALAEKEREIDRLTLVLRERDAALAAKQGEIDRLATVLAERETALAEKEREIDGVREKDEQIHSLTREAEARLAIIEQIQASREYKLGVTALHPWRTLKEKL